MWSGCLLILFIIGIFLSLMLFNQYCLRNKIEAGGTSGKYIADGKLIFGDIDDFHQWSTKFSKYIDGRFPTNILPNTGLTNYKTIPYQAMEAHLGLASNSSIVISVDTFNLLTIEYLVQGQITRVPNINFLEPYDMSARQYVELMISKSTNIITRLEFDIHRYINQKVKTIYEDTQIPINNIGVYNRELNYHLAINSVDTIIDYITNNPDALDYSCCKYEITTVFDKNEWNMPNNLSRVANKEFLMGVIELQYSRVDIPIATIYRGHKMVFNNKPIRGLESSSISFGDTLFSGIFRDSGVEGTSACTWTALTQNNKYIYCTALMYVIPLNILSQWVIIPPLTVLQTTSGRGEWFHARSYGYSKTTLIDQHGRLKGLQGDPGFVDLYKDTEPLKTSGQINISYSKFLNQATTICINGSNPWRVFTNNTQINLVLPNNLGILSNEQSIKVLVWNIFYKSFTDPDFALSGKGDRVLHLINGAQSDLMVLTEASSLVPDPSIGENNWYSQITLPNYTTNCVYRAKKNAGGTLIYWSNKFVKYGDTSGLSIGANSELPSPEPPNLSDDSYARPAIGVKLRNRYTNEQYLVIGVHLGHYIYLDRFQTGINRILNRMNFDPITEKLIIMGDFNELYTTNANIKKIDLNGTQVQLNSYDPLRGGPYWTCCGNQQVPDLKPFIAALASDLIYSNIKHFSVNAVEDEASDHYPLLGRFGSHRQEQQSSNIGDDFVSLLPSGVINVDLTNCINWTYTKIAIVAFRKYKNNLNNINITPYSTDITNNAYIKMFCNQIWNNVSTKAYTNTDPSYAFEMVEQGIFRPNHGGLNHMRSLKYALIVIKLIVQSPNYQIALQKGVSLFAPNEFLVMFICSTIFEAIMRVDEQGSGGVVCNFKAKYFHKLYPSLDFYTYGTGGASTHQIASSIFYSVMMKHCFTNIGIPKIDELSRAVSFYWNNQLLTIEHLTINDINKPELQFFIYYVIMNIGHYLDHCRGRFSDMINKEDIQELFRLFNISQEDQIMLNKLVIRELVATEFIGFNGNIDDIDYTDMHRSCSKLYGRYYNPNWLRMSTDFNLTWGNLNIDQTIRITTAAVQLAAQQPQQQQAAAAAAAQAKQQQAAAAAAQAKQQQQQQAAAQAKQQQAAAAAAQAKQQQQQQAAAQAKQQQQQQAAEQAKQQQQQQATVAAQAKQQQQQQATVAAQAKQQQAAAAQAQQQQAAAAAQAKQQQAAAAQAQQQQAAAAAQAQYLQQQQQQAAAQAQYLQQQQQQAAAQAQQQQQQQAVAAAQAQQQQQQQAAAQAQYLQQQQAVAAAAQAQYLQQQQAAAQAQQQQQQQAVAAAQAQQQQTAAVQAQVQNAAAQAAAQNPLYRYSSLPEYAFVSPEFTTENYRPEVQAMRSRDIKSSYRNRLSRKRF